jgi:hypothetical protein
MCQSSASTTSRTPGADDDPVIYSMPGSVVPDMQTALADNADATSVSFTANGSLYLSAVSQNRGSGATHDAETGSVSLLGVSGVDGAQTGVNVENVSVSPVAGGAADQRRLSMVFRMTAPRQAAVQFVFDVNANSVALRSATPVDDTGRPVADGAALGLDFSTIWCVTKNGGAAILPALVKALPSLIGGPAAFLTAVLAAMPGVAITTAQSVIANCFG